MVGDTGYVTFISIQKLHFESSKKGETVPTAHPYCDMGPKETAGFTKLLSSYIGKIRYSPHEERFAALFYCI